MGRMGITDQKLMEIASEIGNGNATKLGLSLGLSSTEVDSLDMNSYKVLRKARDGTTIKAQKGKLREGLIKSGHRAAADKHLPERLKKESLSIPKTSLPKKRELDSPTENATPAKRKPRAKSNMSKLEEEKKKLKELKADRDVLLKKQKVVAKDIEQNNKEIEKTENAVKKLMEQEIQDDMKKIEKRKKELEKLNLCGVSNTCNTNS